MSKPARQTQLGGRNSQHTTGRDFYNPNPAQDLYDREFNGVTDGLSDVRRRGNAIINDNADAVRKQEETPEARRPITHPRTGRSAKLRHLFTSKRLRGKTSLITVMLLLFGGGGAVTIFSSPSLAVVQLSQVLTQDLNDQLKSFDSRHAYLMRAKFKTITSGSCGAVKIACRMAKPSDKQLERFRSKGITVDVDTDGRISRMVFPGSNGDPDVEVKSAAELHDKMTNDMTVRTGMQRAENPWFASMTDKTFKTTLRLLGTSKASRISGDTNEEREKSVNNAIGESSEIDARTMTPEKDKDGKETGRYIGPDGQVLSQQQIDTINESGKISESAGKIKPAKILSSIGKGVMITAVLDSACTAYNASRMVGALAKVDMAKQAAQMATSSANVPASRSMAGVATDGEMEFVGNKINGIGGPAQPDEIVDESKIYDNGSAQSIPMKKNDTQYNTAFDSPGVKAALYGDVTPLDSSQGRFSLGGGYIGTLNKINEIIARVVNFGNPDPKQVSKKCGYIQNPYVRGTALVAGILVGIGSFGTWQAAGVVGSLAFAAALPTMLSKAADMVSGDMFKNLYGEDFGSGAFVGTAAIMSTAAQRRGMEPLSAEEAVAYTKSNKQSLAQYADVQRYMARSEPFNVYNQYSFLGSLAAAVTPQLSQSRASVGMMAMSLTTMIPKTFASLTGIAKADNTIERFQQCPDPMYQSLNIGADMYCNVRYGLSDEELAMDPIENAKWMAATNNITSDSGTSQQSESATPPTTTPSTKLGSVYVLGDSISVGATSEYQKQLQAAGATDVKVSASGGGNLESPGTTGTMKSGLQSISDDASYIKNASTIIIEHGTNQLASDSVTNGYVTRQQQVIKKVMDAIKATGTKAKVYWVDVGLSTQAPSNVGAYAGPINQAIYGAQSNGYQVISWAKAVDPTVDPATQSKPLNDSSHKLADGVHPVNPAEYVQNIIKNLSATSASDNTDSSQDVTDGTSAEELANTANTAPWNYAKFLKECAYRTVGWGEDQEEDQGDGSDCLSEKNEPLNKHFRIFTMDLSVMDYMDGVDEVGSVTSGETGPVSADGWAYPTTRDAEMTSGYKPADRPDHRGVDLAQRDDALGKPIYAAYDGKVVASGPADGFGNWIVIEHDVNGKKMSTVYGHMRANDLLVKAGDTVKAGQLIARIGSEGQSTGPHLHFEIWNGNRLDCGGDCSIDPTPILAKIKSSSGNEVKL